MTTEALHNKIELMQNLTIPLLPLVLIVPLFVMIGVGHLTKNFKRDVLSSGIPILAGIITSCLSVSVALNYGNTKDEYIKEYIDRLPIETYAVEDIVTISKVRVSNPNFQPPTEKKKVQIRYTKDGTSHLYEGYATVQDEKGDTLTYKTLDEPIGNRAAGIYQVIIK